MKTNNQQGFSVVEAFIAAVVLGLLGFTGWAIYHNQTTQVVTPPITAQHTSKHTDVATNGQQSTAPKKYSSTDAANLVQSTYDRYLAAEVEFAPTDAQPTGFEGLPAIQDSMTPSLYAAISSGQRGKVPMTCSISQSIPQGALAFLDSDDATQAIVNVSLNYSGKTVPEGVAPSVAFTVDLASQKITDVRCL